MRKLNIWIEDNLDELFATSRDLKGKSFIKIEKEKQKFKTELLDHSQMKLLKSQNRRRGREIRESKDWGNKNFVVKQSKV